MRLLLYRFKCILKTKGIFLKAVIFPIIVATLCYTSFERTRYGTVFKGEKIAVGIVAGDGISKDIFDEDRFEIYNVSEIIAEKYLEEGIISSYIRMEKQPELITIHYEDEQRMTKAYLDAYLLGVSPARLESQHAVQRIEEKDRSVFLSNHAKFVMATICTLLAAVLLIEAIERNKSKILIRSRMAAISEWHMVLQDMVVVISLLVVIFVVVYGYIYFILKA